MKFGLDVADAWLNALSSAWKRAAFFWGFVVLVSCLAALIFDRAYIGDVFQLGGLTLVILGPVAAWSILVTLVTWIRYIHLESAGVRAFGLIAVLIMINGWFFDHSLSVAHLMTLQCLALTLVVGTLVWTRKPTSS